MQYKLSREPTLSVFLQQVINSFWASAASRCAQLRLMHFIRPTCIANLIFRLSATDKHYFLVTKMTLTKLIVLSSFALSTLMDAYACSVLKPGSNFDMDDLIAEAGTIALVRLESSNRERFGTTTHLLKTVEIIKGKGEKFYSFESFGSKVSDNDFDGHTSPDFWNRPSVNKPNSRSDFPCCLCGPDHGFRKGRNYLYFPDQLGALKSAEVVHNVNDKWLQYVRAKVLSANSALHGKQGSNRATELKP